MPILMIGVMEFQTPVFVWGKRMMINIEGEIKKNPSKLREVQPDKKNMTGGGSGLSLSPAANRLPPPLPPPKNQKFL